MELRGKTVLVTGAAARIGKAIALAVAERGADVAVHYHRSADAAAAVAAAIRERGVRAIPCGADLEKPDELRSLVATALGEFGHIDALVNNAAIFPRTPFLEMTEAEWDRTLDTNLKAPALLAQSVAPGMLARGHGKIVNIADIGALRPWPSYLPYCVSKAGVVTMTQVLARALAPTIQVNAVAPGAILFPDDWDAARRQRLLDQIPMQRTGEPDEIARTVLFLLEGPEYITGAVIPVDGGRSI